MKTIKKLIYIVILLAGTSSFSSCETEIELPVMTVDEYPRIFGRFPEKDGNVPGIITRVKAGSEYNLTVQYTPSNLCTAVWYIDGVEYTTGPVFSFLTETTGTYVIKLVVSTSKYTTSREAKLIVE